MKKNDWKKKIKQASEEAGTYKDYFDAVIDTLAGILEKRDVAADALNAPGATLTASDIHRNPMVVIWNDLNKSALAYWKELGLTPAGLKKLNEDTFVKRQKASSLMDLLKKSKEEE